MPRQLYNPHPVMYHLASGAIDADDLPRIRVQSSTVKGAIYAWVHLYNNHLLAGCQPNTNGMLADKASDPDIVVDIMLCAASFNGSFDALNKWFKDVHGEAAHMMIC